MNSDQCRMARAAKKWSLDDLSRASGVGRATIQRFESGKDAYTSTAQKLQAAFEQNGIIFISQNGGGPGVRLKDLVDNE